MPALPLLAAVLFAPCSILQQSTPASPDAVTLESRVERAALFKNGLAFVTRTASVPSGAREVRLVDLPAPAHGSFWWTSDPKRLTFERAVARSEFVLERAPVASLEELLRASVGSSVALTLTDDSILSGKIVAMPAEEPGPTLAADVDPRFGRALTSPAPRGGLLFLENDGGVIALPISQVVRVRAQPGGGLPLAFERRRAATSLTLRTTTHGDQDAELGLRYLTGGLTWAPSYSIDISDPEVARLAAKATVLNDSEELVGTTLELVTGYPNLHFSNVQDPIAMRAGVDAFLHALSQAGVVGAVAAVVTQRVMSNIALARQSASGATAPWESAAGAAVGDLFFYPVEDVTLARGERGVYPLFALNVPYRHVYQWDVPDTIDLGGGSRSEESELDEIWHSLRLQNESALPWTTAPAMTLEGGRLLGQDVLTYTAAGASSSVRITRAVDVQGEKSEVETGRERQNATFFGRRYDLVTIEGVLRATNHKSDAVSLEIEKRLQGVVTMNPDGATVTTSAEGLRRVNPNQRLAWTLQLGAGETAEVRYSYTLYVNT